jgi:hypothetical protein
MRVRRGSRPAPGPNGSRQSLKRVRNSVTSVAICGAVARPARGQVRLSEEQRHRIDPVVLRDRRQHRLDDRGRRRGRREVGCRKHLSHRGDRGPGRHAVDRREVLVHDAGQPARIRSLTADQTALRGSVAASNQRAAVAPDRLYGEVIVQPPAHFLPLTGGRRRRMNVDRASERGKQGRVTSGRASTTSACSS